MSIEFDRFGSNFPHFSGKKKNKLRLEAADLSLDLSGVKNFRQPLNFSQKFVLY